MRERERRRLAGNMDAILSSLIKLSRLKAVESGANTFISLVFTLVQYIPNSSSSFVIKK